MARPPPPPPRRKRSDTQRRLRRIVTEEERERFDPSVPPVAYAKRHHFAVNADVFDLDAEGIALPGDAIRLLGEYAQGNGPAKALYVKATDHELASLDEIAMAIAELQRQNERLNSGELDRLVRELQQQISPDEAEEDRLSFDLNEREEESLRYIAGKCESAQILYDAYDPSDMTIPRSEVIRAFFATPGDGGDLGTVPLAGGGTLGKKIEELWGDAEAFEEWERADQEGRHEEDQD